MSRIGIVSSFGVFLLIFTAVQPNIWANEFPNTSWNDTKFYQLVTRGSWPNWPLILNFPNFWSPPLTLCFAHARLPYSTHSFPSDASWPNGWLESPTELPPLYDLLSLGTVALSRSNEFIAIYLTLFFSSVENRCWKAITDSSWTFIVYSEFSCNVSLLGSPYSEIGILTVAFLVEFIASLDISFPTTLTIFSLHQ